jgi:hypothetical protein
MPQQQHVDARQRRPPAPRRPAGRRTSRRRPPARRSRRRRPGIACTRSAGTPTRVEQRRRAPELVALVVVGGHEALVAPPDVDRGPVDPSRAGSRPVGDRSRTAVPMPPPVRPPTPSRAPPGGGQRATRAAPPRAPAVRRRARRRVRPAGGRAARPAPSRERGGRSPGGEVPRRRGRGVRCRAGGHGTTCPGSRAPSSAPSSPLGDLAVPSSAGPGASRPHVGVASRVEPHVRARATARQAGRRVAPAPGVGLVGVQTAQSHRPDRRAGGRAGHGSPPPVRAG